MEKLILESLEKAMWAVGQEVFGLQRSNTGKKPFLNYRVLKLKTAIKASRSLLYVYNRGEVRAAKVRTQWSGLRAKYTAADCTSLLSEFFKEDEDTGVATSVWSTLDADAVKEGIKKCVTSLRTRIRLECRAMQRATLATT